MSQPEKVGQVEKVNPHFKIGVYGRSATEEFPFVTDLREQERQILEFIDRKGDQGKFGKVVGSYLDANRSGHDLYRPELQRLLTAVMSQEVSLLIVTDLERLSKSVEHFFEIWSVIQKNGCSLITLNPYRYQINDAAPLPLS